MQLSGTSVLVEESGDATALVFRTSGDVAELQRRVRLMADRHEGLCPRGGSAA